MGVELGVFGSRHSVGELGGDPAFGVDRTDSVHSSPSHASHGLEVSECRANGNMVGRLDLAAQLVVGDRPQSGDGLDR